VSLAKLSFISWLVSSFVFLGQPCRGDTPALPVIPKAVDWSTGPIKADLGNFAEIRVPMGYRFADARNARVLLETMRSPVPRGLVGVLSPVSGEFFVMLQYTELGFVKEEAGKLDEDATLKTIWQRLEQENKDKIKQGETPVTHVQWAVKPVYDSHAHILEAAMRTDGRSDSDSSIHHDLYLLGRTGVIQANVARSRRDSSDLTVFKELLRAVSFKSGHAYADFRNSDRLASGGLAGLLTSDRFAPAKPMAVADTSGGMKTFWVVVLVLCCIAISGIVVLARKLHQHRALHAPAAPPAPKAAVTRTNGFKLEHKLAPALKALNEHNHNHNGQGKRKRMFNYHKFYTEMVLQGPAPVITDGYTGFNGHELDSSYRNNQNGNGHGNHNGNCSNANGNGNGNGHVGSEPSGAVLNAHSELIASQKSLIEEQKRLIHEQARLIEEKSKLISEKNQLLDRQSQLIDNNLL